MGLQFLRALGSFLFALFYLVFVFPIAAIVATGLWLFKMARYSPWLFLLLAVAIVSPFVARNHNKVVSYGEYFMRCTIEPVWTETLLPIVELVEAPFNLLVCWWDAFNWAGYGYFNEFLIPAVIECGAKRLIFTIPPIVRVLFREFIVDFVLLGRFLTGFYDITNLGLAIIPLVDAWVDMLCCLCMDLCPLFKCSPIPVLFIVYPWFQVSSLFRYMDFYQAVGAGINVIAAIIQILVRLIIQIFTVGFSGIDPRPDFEDAAHYFCKFNFHIFRAIELALQCFWDSFMPWRFNFINFLCLIDTLSCILSDSIVVATRCLINVDKLVFDMFTPDPVTGHGPRPGSIWHGSIKVIVVRILNTWAPVTDVDYFYDVHLIGRTTMRECLCIAIRRIICDPTDANTACFSQGAVDFLQNFDFCCLTNSLLTLLNDFAKGLYELFLHTTDADAFFIWVDSQKNFGILIGYKGDAVQVVSCLLSAFEFIPVVGYCLKHIVVSMFAFVTGMIDWSFRFTLSLITLPYFIVALNNRYNFLLRPLEAVTLWEETVDLLVALTPTSALNCLCFIHNIFPIPPITLDINNNFVQCGCKQIGFIPPPATFKMSLEDAFNWSDDYLGYQFKRSAINRVTPILQYAVEKEIRAKGESVINPVYLKERILENMALYGATVIPAMMRDVDSFIESKVTTLRTKWGNIKQCQEWREEAEQIRVKYAWRYRYLQTTGQLPGQKECAGLEEYLNPVGDTERDQAIMMRPDSENYLDYIDEIDLQGRDRNHTKPSLLIPATTPWNPQFRYRLQPDTPSKGVTERVSTRPPEPTVAGCPAPGLPLNECFDLCCVARSSALLGGHILKMLARLLNAFIQGEFQSPKWSYFTASASPGSPGPCPKCFEQDLTTLIVYMIQPIVCLCRLHNLILPSSPNFPRPDLCCALAMFADFIGCQLQVVINGIKSLAMDSPNFVYFTAGQFMRDADVLFDITLGIVSCLCNVVRYIFPIGRLTGGGFDPCCLAEKVFIVLVEMQRMLLQIIINLALIVATTTAVNYWRDPGIARGYAIIDNIGVVKQADVVITAIFGKPGGICSGKMADQGIGGLSQCVCQILSTVIPIRPRPGQAVSEPDNCPFFDLCCPIRGINFVLGEWTRFQFRVLVSTWQSWTYRDYSKPIDGVSPIAFLDFVFCNEDATQLRGCGRLKPTIDAIFNVIVDCPCQFGALADAWLTLVLPSKDFRCFCGGDVNTNNGDGFFRNIGTLIKEIVSAVITLIRRISDPTYWAFEQGGPSRNALEDSWAYRFGAKPVMAVCNLITSILCVANSIINLPCTENQKRIVRSVVRWIGEIVLRVLAFLQGFILIFAMGHTDPCVEGQTGCTSGNASAGGISIAQLANVWVSLAGFPLDMLFGDSSILCSVLNPPVCPASDPCCCYKPRGTYKQLLNVPGFSADRSCAQCIDSSCNTLVTSYSYATCTVCPPSGCAPAKPCVDFNLVSCDVRNSLLNPLDGIVMALMRYMRCMIAAIPGIRVLAPMFDVLISFISFIWQIFGPILRFVASLFLFFILIFRFVSGGCGCHGMPNGAYVQRGGLCYPCEEQPNLRGNNWWSTPTSMEPPPRPDGRPGLCLAGYNYYDNTWTHYTDIKANSRGQCIHTKMAAAGGCRENCGSNNPADTCPVCNWYNNVIGEVGNSIDCDAFNGGSCTMCGANPMVLCGIIQLWEGFRDVLRAFVQVFEKPPINPTPPPSKRSDKGWERFAPPATFNGEHLTMKQFKEKAESRTRGVYDGKGVFELMLSAVWDYDLSDCPTDIRTCACRNLILPSEVCQPDHPELKLRSGERNPRVVDELSKPVLTHMADLCSEGHTRCDYLISGCGNTKWSNVTNAERFEYVDCLDKIIQGQRLNAMIPSFPANFFYTNTGPLTFAHNLQIAATEAMESGRVMHEAVTRRKRETVAGKRETSRAQEEAREIELRRERIIRDAEKDPMTKNSMALSFFVEFDQYEYSLRSGRFFQLARDAWYNLKHDTVIIPVHSVWDAFKDQTAKFGSGVYQVQWRKTLDSVYRGVGSTFEAIDTIVTRGPVAIYREAHLPVNMEPSVVQYRKEAAQLRDLASSAMYQSPFYKWWSAPSPPKDAPGSGQADFSNPFGVFTEHMRRTIKGYRTNWKRDQPNGFTLDLHTHDGFLKTVGKRWEMKWTPEKLSNWESLGRVFYKMKHALVPGSMTEETRGFIINGNCKIVDGLIDEIVFLVTYCANDFVPNFPVTKRNELRQTSEAWRWFESMAEKGEYLYGDKTGRAYMEKDTRDDDDAERVWTDSLDWLMHRGLNWRREKIAPAEHPGAKERWQLLKHISRQQWLRAVASVPFDISDWLIGIVDSIFGTNLSMEVAVFIANLEEWIAEENIDYMAGPVGLKYWALFWVRCQFKPRPGQLPSNAALNLSCKVGVGLEAALGQVIPVILLIVIIGMVVLPGTLTALLAPLMFITFVIAVPAVAWHYSPRCWLMTPAMSIPGVTGLSMPFIGIPIAFPAVPFCALSQVRQLVSKYITKCYRVLWGTNLELLFPPYMIPGDACPMCPEKVYFYNCRDLGLGNALSNVIYFLQRIWPGARTVAYDIRSLWILNQGGWLEQTASQTMAIFDTFANPTVDQQKQFDYCFGVTIMSLASFGIVAIFGIFFLIFFVKLCAHAARSIFAVIVTSPLWYILPGSGVSLQEQITGEGDDNGRDDPKDAYIGVQFSDNPRDVDESGRRQRYAYETAYEDERVRRTNRQAHFFGWIDSVSLAIVDGLGHAVKAIKRD